MPPKVDGEDKLFEDNQNLIWAVIRQKFDRAPLEIDDMFQLGSAGLTRAIRTYDGSRGAFSTHAIHLISNEIYREIRFTTLVKNKPKGKAVSKDAKRNPQQMEQIDDGKLFDPFDAADPTQDVEAACVLQDNLDRALSVLSPRERYVMEGLLGGKIMDELAGEYGVCRQRVQQIAARARRKMAAVYER
jgi:RNA polymerase sigma factor (sigma-70 family)